MGFVGNLRGLWGYALKKIFHPSFTNIIMSMNTTLVLYERYVCLQFDMKAKRVNLQVVVNNSKLISHFLSYITFNHLWEKEYNTCTCTSL